MPFRWVLLYHGHKRSRSFPARHCTVSVVSDGILHCVWVKKQVGERPAFPSWPWMMTRLSDVLALFFATSFTPGMIWNRKITVNIPPKFEHLTPIECDALMDVVSKSFCCEIWRNGLSIISLRWYFFTSGILFGLAWWEAPAGRYKQLLLKQRVPWRSRIVESCNVKKVPLLEKDMYMAFLWVVMLLVLRNTNTFTVHMDFVHNLSC